MLTFFILVVLAISSPHLKKEIYTAVDTASSVEKFTKK